MNAAGDPIHPNRFCGDSPPAQGFGATQDAGIRLRLSHREVDPLRISTAGPVNDETMTRFASYFIDAAREHRRNGIALGTTAAPDETAGVVPGELIFLENPLGGVGEDHCGSGGNVGLGVVGRENGEVFAGQDLTPDLPE